MSAPREDPRVVLEVAPNPKRPGTASHARYERWQVGQTVTSAMRAGVTRGDVTWDTSRGYVKLSDG